jgi:hypothetical protein
MSEKLPSCSGSFYRGHLIMTLVADNTLRVIVCRIVHRQVISLYECERMGEAYSLVDAICAKQQAENLPAGEAGGARAVECVAGSMQPA